MSNFLVVRFSNKADGTVSAPIKACDTLVEAQKEFYRLCGLAVDSTHFTDSVTIIDNTGAEVDHAYFVHEAAEE